MREYTVLEDHLLACLYCCEDCGDKVEVPPYDHQNIGTPVCADCGSDMVYIETRQYNNVRIMQTFVHQITRLS